MSRKRPIKIDATDIITLLLAQAGQTDNDAGGTEPALASTSGAQRIGPAGLIISRKTFQSDD